jgi:cephalosporin hydroxylase
MWMIANDRNNIVKMSKDDSLKKQIDAVNKAIVEYKYSYNFSWLGRPVIQLPQELIAMQEIIWQVKPDLIIETGIAHGGSLIFSASILALLDYCDEEKPDGNIEFNNTLRHVIGVDIDIRSQNRKAIESHPMAHRINMIEGSSIDSKVVEQVHNMAKGHKTILVCLDSLHTHKHVLAELNAYAPLVTKGSYCVVFDTLIEDLPEDIFFDQPWNKGNNPKTAVQEYLKSNSEFIVDKELENKLLITSNPGGYLKRVRNEQL